MMDRLKAALHAAITVAGRFSIRAVDFLLKHFAWFMEFGLTRALPWVKVYAQALRERVRGREKRIVVVSAATVGAAVILLTTGVFIKYWFDRDSITYELSTYRQWMQGEGGVAEKPPIQIYSQDEKLLGEYLPERQSRITIGQCQGLTWLSRAAVSAEDREFFSHGGVSYRGVARAMLRNLVTLSAKEGGGSITQQLARNLFTSRRTPGLIRKIYETFAAFQIENELSKKEILCLYLNKIYMGEGRIGAEEASYFYFRKPPQELDMAEAAMIVGLFPSPARYSPLNNIRFSLAKQHKVLDAMARDGFLKEKDVTPVVAGFIKRYAVHVGDKEASPGLVGIYGANRSFRTNLSPDVNEYAVRFLREAIAENVILEGGLKIYTTIDSAREQAAVLAARTQIERIRADFGRGIPFPPSTARQLVSQLNTVLVAMDPENGGIRALVGGYSLSYEGPAIDRAWQMKRQPGSAIKGFLYAVAMDQGVLKEDDDVVDEAISIHGYAPHNWYPGYKGKVTLRQAVAQSINTIAVKTLHQLGPGRLRDRIRTALDLDWATSRSRFPDNLSLALGSGEVTPVELATLYAPMLRSGRSVTPRLVTKIVSKDGDTLWDEGSPPRGTEVISPAAAASAIRLMESVVEESGTAEWIARQRTRNGKFLPFPLAGKSGTVETEASIVRRFGGMRGVHDAWFVALVPGEVAVVWIGHDAGAPFVGSGSTTAGSLWAAYAQAALAGRIHGEFPTEGIKEKEENEDPLNKPEEGGNNAQNPGNDPPLDPAQQPEEKKQPKKIPEPIKNDPIKMPEEKPVG